MSPGAGNDRAVAALPAAATMHRLEVEMSAVVRRVRRVAAERAALVDPALGPLGYAVLEHLLARGPARAGEIACSLCVDKGAMSRTVRQLQELHLVERSEDPDDRRAHRLAVTEKARARLDEMLRGRRRAFQERMADWRPEDLELFVELLHRYNATLETGVSDG